MKCDYFTYSVVKKRRTRKASDRQRSVSRSRSSSRDRMRRTEKYDFNDRSLERALKSRDIPRTHPIPETPDDNSESESGQS